MHVTDLALFGGAPAVSADLPGWDPMSPDEVDAVTRAARDVPLTTLWGDFEVGAFEAEFAARMGSEHAVAVTSGTTALHAALMAADIGPGDEVIVTPFSFIASVSVVIAVGAQPVFADIEPDGVNMDPARVADLVTTRTRAILPVHHSGYPADLDAFAEIAGERGLLLIEDAAAAHGASVGGRCVGTVGDYGCFSFNIGKILRSGEGGMVLTSDASAAERLRQIRVNGLRPSPNGTVVQRLGGNYTMPQTSAAIGRRQLARFDFMLERRRSGGLAFIDAVAGLPVSVPPEAPGRQRVFYDQPFVLDPGLASARDQIISALQAEGVPAMTSRKIPLHQVPYVREVSPEATCPVAEDLVRRAFFIDPLPGFTDDQIEAICHGLRKVLEHTDDILRQPA